MRAHAHPIDEHCRFLSEWTYCVLQKSIDESILQRKPMTSAVQIFTLASSYHVHGGFFPDEVSLSSGVLIYLVYRGRRAGVSRRRQ